MVDVKDRTGETRMMKCGMEATIVGYRSNKDIDVQFTDGLIVKSKRYIDFKKGAIGNANIIRGQDRLNETRLMNCGLKATIIEYRGCADVDVRFENGAVRKNIIYKNFVNGAVSCPLEDGSNICMTKARRLGVEKYVGMVVRQNCGLDAECTDYINAKNLTIRFSDGLVRSGIGISHFTSGGVGHYIGNAEGRVVNQSAKKASTTSKYEGTKGVARAGRVVNQSAKKASIISKYIGKTGVTREGLAYKVVGYKDGILQLEVESVAQPVFRVSAAVRKGAVALSSSERWSGARVCFTNGMSGVVTKVNKPNDIRILVDNHFEISRSHESLLERSDRLVLQRDEFVSQCVGYSRVMNNNELCKVTRVVSNARCLDEVLIEIEFADGAHDVWAVKSFMSGICKSDGNRRLYVGSSHLGGTVFSRYICKEGVTVTDIQMDNKDIYINIRGINCNSGSLDTYVKNSKYAKCFKYAYTLNKIDYYTVEIDGIPRLGTYEELRKLCINVK